MDLATELSTVCGVCFLAHEEACVDCDMARSGDGILRLCQKGRELFATWLLATLNEPEEEGILR